jgi:hypothetical protein
MKNFSLGQTLTFLANVGVIVGIAVLVYELQQARNIALSELYQLTVANQIEIGNAISANAELWSRGNSGEPLNDVEMAIYSRQVRNINDDAYFRVQIDRLMLPQAETADVADFALYLHRNPGAFDVWNQRHEDLDRYRRFVDPDEPYAGVWRNSILSAIETFREQESNATSN